MKKRDRRSHGDPLFFSEPFVPFLPFEIEQLPPRLGDAGRNLAATNGRALQRAQHTLGQVARHLDK
jgi:hypothetical protein